MNRLRTLTTAAAVSALVIGSSTAALAGGRPLSADLDAANEVGVAAPGDEGATGTADLTFNQGLGEICFEIEIDGLDAPLLAGHIHVGEAGENGPIIVDLGVTQDNLEGCVDGLERELVKEIRKNPSEYYVNVHNAVSPAGAARGQLSR